MKDLLSLTIPDQSGTPVTLKPPDNIPTTEYTIGSIATGALNVAMLIGIILSLLYLIYGGWYWLQSKGDKEKLDKARRIIVYAVLGLIIMSMAFLFVNIIAQALDLDFSLK